MTIDQVFSLSYLLLSHFDGHLPDFMAECSNKHVVLFCIEADTANVAINSSSEGGCIDNELDCIVVCSHHNDLAVTTSSDHMSWSHCDRIDQLCVVLTSYLRAGCTVPQE